MNLAMLRFITLAVTVLLGVAPGCGKKPVKITADGAVLELPAGTDTSKLSMRVVTTPMPAALERATLALAEHFTVLKVLELRPDGTELGNATLVVTIASTALPAPRTLRDVVAVRADSAGRVQTLPVTVAADKLTVPVQRMGVVAFLVPLPGVTLLGTPGLLVRGATEPLLSADCTAWITPESPAIALLAADQARVLVDAAKIQLDTLAITDRIDEAAQGLKADEILRKGTADRSNAAIVFASLLVARGLPARLVAGAASSKGPDGVSKGFHQWAETVINGVVYVVDATVPKGARLIPRAEAEKALGLVVHRSCEKSPPGGAARPFDPPPAPPAAPTP